MDRYQLLSQISGIIFVFAFFPYIRAIIRRQTVPSFFTWGLWAALDIVTFIAMLGEGAEHLWLIGAAIFGASTVTLLSLKYGERSINRTNVVCTLLVTVAIVLKANGAGLLSLFAGLIGLMVAAVPLLINAWHKPGTEDRKSWVLFVASSVAACMAVDDWSLLGDSLPPATFLFIDAIILGIVLLRPLRANVNANV